MPYQSNDKNCAKCNKNRHHYVWFQLIEKRYSRIASDLYTSLKEWKKTVNSQLKCSISLCSVFSCTSEKMRWGMKWTFFFFLNFRIGDHKGIFRAISLPRNKQQSFTASAQLKSEFKERKGQKRTDPIRSVWYLIMSQSNRK